MRTLCAAIVTTTAMFAWCGGAYAITAGHTDDFQDGTTLNWSGGGGEANIATGGPAGAGDKYLQYTSNSNLATYNLNQWAGDYAAPAITDVSADLMDLPTQSPLSMRIVLFGPTGSRWTSTTATSIPADGQWHHVVFSIRQADLINVLNSGDTYAQTVGGVSRLMFRHDTVGSSGGSPFTGSAGLDNVTAVAAPEPTSLALLAMAGLLLKRKRA